MPHYALFLILVVKMNIPSYTTKKLPQSCNPVFEQHISCEGVLGADIASTLFSEVAY